MGETFQKRISALLLSNRRHARYLAVLVCSALVVALGVTATLMRPGQAKTHEETVLDCQYSGNGAHTHDASCYDADGNLVCPLAEREYHVHDDSCYASETYLVCGLEEGEGAHTHDDSCYDEEGNLVCGFEESEGHAHTDACWQTDTYLACGKDEVTESHTHGEGCFKTIVVTDEEPEAAATAAEAEPAAETEAAADATDEAKADDAAKAATDAEAEEAMPEQSFKEDLKAVDENGDEYVLLTVSVKAPKGALPKGSTMKIKAVDENAIADKVDEAVKAKVGEGAVVKSMTAVDISFLDKDGAEVEPAKKVEVKITSDQVKGIDAPTLVHIDKDDNAAVVTGTKKVNADEKDTTTGNEDTLKFDTDEFSPYVIVETEELHAELLSGNGGVYDVVLTAGQDAGIPAGSTLQVSELVETSRAYLSAFDAVVAQKQAEDEDFDESSLRMAALDITILDPEGNVFEPLAPVNVAINVAELPEGVAESDSVDTLELQHFDTSTGAIVVETVATVAEETLAVEGEAAEAEFTVESFSTFALTWTDGSATVHWGKITDGTFEEFDAASLDTSVGSIELRASYSGYEYVDAVYYATKPDQPSIDASIAIDGRTFINDVITKEEATGGAEAYQWIAEDSHNNAQHFPIADGGHIYAVYAEPDPAHPHGPTPPGSDEIPTPTTEKHVTDNTNPDGTPDGTYTIELDITGAQVSETHQTGANVVIIYDISQSMSQSVGTMTRLEASRRATHTLIDTLKPGTNDIDLALITFAQDAQTRTFGGSNWTKNGTNITNVVDGITNVSQNLGTSWHEALQNAYNLTPPDDDPTYVIFITDGCPSVNGLTSSGHSHGAAGTNNTSDLCYTAAVAYSKMIAGTKGQSYSTRVTSGYDSWNINGTGKGEYLYGIYTGTDTNNMLGRLVTASNGSRVITATNESDINSAFKDIAQTIVEFMGATGVTTTDGVTELSSISADVHGTAGAFEYYRKGGKNEDGTEKYDRTANAGLGETWSDAPGAIYNDDGSVTWDLSSVGTAEAEVTYVVRFTVWPSQEAYDIIANLNNRVVDYDDLPEDVQEQIYEDGGKYYLKTNTTLNTSYTFRGNTYTDPITFTNGKMVLDETQMDVRKAFDHDIHGADQYSQLDFYLTIDGKYYMADGTTSSVKPTKTESAGYYTISLPNGDPSSQDSWKGSVFIAPGVMKDGEVLETGHKYSLYEIIREGSEYEYEFTPQVVRPMEINGHLTYLVLVDKYNGPGKNNVPANVTQYYIDDANGTYREAAAGDTENVYYVSQGSTGELVGTNRKTAELDITKWIVDNTGKLTPAQMDAETFTYRVTLSVPENGDPTGMMGYEFVPRDDSDVPGSAERPRYKIAGYQGEATGTPYAPDNTRFKYVSQFEGTYGAWNTQVYQYFVDTEVVDGKVIVVRDANGNFTWRDDITHEGGYYTVTLDVTINRNEVYRFNNLPSGTVYTIEEIYWNKYRADAGGPNTRVPSSDPSNISDSGYTVTANNGAFGDTVTGTIDDLDERYYNQFVNTLDEAVDAELKVTKALDGYDWTDADRYYFNLAAGDNTAEGDVATPLPVAGQLGRTRFYITSTTSGHTYTFGRIRFTKEGTYTYTITEDESGAGVPGISYDTKRSEKTVTVTVGRDAQGKLAITSIVGEETAFDEPTATATTTVTNAVEKTTANAKKEWLNADESTDAPDGASVTFQLYKQLGDGDITATDRTVTLDGSEEPAWTATFGDLDAYEIGVESYTEGEKEMTRHTSTPITYYVAESEGWAGYKAVPAIGQTVASGGTITNEQASFEVALLKLGDGDTRTPLANVEFKLYSQSPYTEANQIKKDALGNNIGGDQNGVIRTGTDGKRTIGTLTAGTYYLVETKGHEGYNKLSDAVVLTVNADGTVSATNTGIANPIIPARGDTPVTVMVSNPSGAALPHTGGPGTTLFTITGSAVLAMAVTYGIASRRRREGRSV